MCRGPGYARYDGVETRTHHHTRGQHEHVKLSFLLSIILWNLNTLLVYCIHHYHELTESINLVVEEYTRFNLQTLTGKSHTPLDCILLLFHSPIFLLLLRKQPEHWIFLIQILKFENYSPLKIVSIFGLCSIIRLF